MNEKIVFFDGVCNLCNGFVDWLMARDQKKLLRYASLQGKTAASKLPAERVQNINTMALYDDGKVYFKSQAVLKTLSYLPVPWNLLSILRIIPSFISNFVYDLVAKYRYVLFGKKDTCRLPTPEELSYFLD
jgi:predicted DCC family thiol-disulfide oxidoreductase YuxK